MAIRRKKSKEQIIAQTARITNAIDRERAKRINTGWGERGDARDDQLRMRGNKALEVGRKYVDNISNKQGTKRWSEDDNDRPIAKKAQMNRKYSQNTYMGINAG